MSFTMIIIESVLRLLFFAFDFMGAKKERKEWLAKTSEILRQKGWVRSTFLLELEKSRDLYLDRKVQQEIKERKEKDNESL